MPLGVPMTHAHIGKEIDPGKRCRENSIAKSQTSVCVMGNKVTTNPARHSDISSASDVKVFTTKWIVYDLVTHCDIELSGDPRDPCTFLSAVGD